MLWLALACTDNSLKTFNSTPDAQIISHETGEDIREGSPITLEAALTDPNVDLEADLDATVALDFAWSAGSVYSNDLTLSVAPRTVPPVSSKEAA